MIAALSRYDVPALPGSTKELLMRRAFAPIVLILSVALAACGGDGDDALPTPPPTVDPAATPAAMTVTSDSFGAGETIPERHTCHGENLSPQLSWSDPPEGTESLAVFVDYPEGVLGSTNYWVLYNLPTDLTELDEGQPTGTSLAGGLQGDNMVDRNPSYFGPCIEPGLPEAEIVVRVVALNTKIRPSDVATQSIFIEREMEGHVLAVGELRGFVESPPVESTPSGTVEPTPAATAQPG
jgi:Raf kinase inhibitor-like YbhB/YbcL family protein